MKMVLEQQDIDGIAQKVFDLMLPLLNQRQEQNDSILSIDEASILLGKSKGQVYQWVSDSRHGLNTLPYLKAGKTLRFSKQALIKWMTDNAKTC
jgi:excisionase family DNA binding protein